MIAARFDFSGPDRIAKSQVRAIHVLHDTFVRNLVYSLSAYLGTYLTASLVSVEQLSYAEFLGAWPTPTCIVSLGLSPYEGYGVVELDPSSIFPILEMLLGATLKSSSSIERDLTEIAQKLLDGHFRVILQDLREAWKAVTPIDFTIEATETEPQLFQPLAPNEAVVSVGVEVRLGETMGMRNIAMTSIVIKMMRLKFDQQWSMRKSQANQADQSRMLRRLRQASLGLEARLHGHMKVKDLLAVREGKLLIFDYPVARVIKPLIKRRSQVHRPRGQHRQKTGMPGRAGQPRCRSRQNKRRAGTVG